MPVRDWNRSLSLRMIAVTALAIMTLSVIAPRSAYAQDKQDPKEKANKLKLVEVGKAKDICDKNKEISFRGAHGDVKVPADSSELVELGDLTKELVWYRGRTGQRCANDSPFNFVLCERAADGAIAWTFYRKPWFGALINEKATDQLIQPVEKKSGLTVYLCGIIAGPKEFQALSKAAGLKELMLDVDWKKHVVVYVILRFNSNAIYFEQWIPPKDGVGELVVEYSGIQPNWGNAYPAVLFRVERKDLRKVNVAITWPGAQKRVPLAELDATALDEYIRKTIAVECRGKLIRGQSFYLDDGRLVSDFLKVRDHEYGLILPAEYYKDKEAEKKMESLKGKSVLVTGRLEVRGGAKDKKYEVIVVSSLKEAETD